MKFSFREISLYRFRYVISYVLFAILLITLLVVDLSNVPAGLSDQEMDSVTKSVTLNVFNSPPEAVVNAPYHLLQKASVGLLGLSPLSIKLPSVILAILLAVGVVGVLRRFFRLSATSITALLMISSLPFLIMGRTGSPLIMLSFLSVSIMVAGALVLTLQKKKTIWKIIAVLSAVALLYTPLGIYPLIAISLAALLHPHLRYHITHTKPLEWAIIAVTAIAAISLLVISIVRQPEILFTLTGIPNELPSLSLMLGNLSQLGSTLFNLTNPKFDFIATPLFGLPLLILMILGAIQLIYDRHSARAYFLLGWLGAFLIILSLNTIFVLNIFVPAVLLLAVGIETLLREWYSLFPRNPYARIAALLPLGVLVFGVATSEVSRYFDGYRHTSSVPSSTFDITLLPLKTTLDEEALESADKVTLVVPRDKIAFYDLLRREYDNLAVDTKPDILTSGEMNIILADANPDIQKDQHGEVYRVVTSAQSSDALLFQVYRAPAQ